MTFKIPLHYSMTSYHFFFLVFWWIWLHQYTVFFPVYYNKNILITDWYNISALIFSSYNLIGTYSFEIRTYFWWFTENFRSDFTYPWSQSVGCPVKTSPMRTEGTESLMGSPFSDQLNSTGREYGLMSGRRLSRSSKKKWKDIALSLI